MATSQTNDPAATEAAPEATRPKGGSKRDDLVYVVRALAIFGVVTIHLLVDHIGSNGMPSKAEALSYEWTNWFLIWCVPFFFITGGAVSYMSMVRTWQRNPDNKWRTGLSFAWKRAQRVMIPYYCLAAIMVTVEFVLGKIGFAQCQGFGLKQALTWIIPFPHDDCLGIPKFPLWFIMVYLPLAMLTPVLTWLWSKGVVAKWALVLVPTALVLFNDRLFYDLRGLDPTNTDAVGAWLQANPQRPAAFLANLALGFLAVFCLGFLYGDGTLNRYRRSCGAVGLGLVAATILLMTVGPYYHGQQQFPLQAGYIFWASGLFLLCVWGRDAVVGFLLSRPLRRFTSWLSDNSYTIYLWHMFGTAALWWTLYYLGLRDWLYSLPVWATHLVLYALVWAYVYVLVKAFHRFEAWTWPPRWWQRRRDPDLNPA